MPTIIKKLKITYFLPFFLATGIIVTAVSSNNQPLFSSLDNFVLFASEELALEKEVQISSGDLGSNKDLDIQKDAIITGNLFADKITLDKNTQINGNVSYNKLKTQKDVQILGTQTKPVSLPIAVLPDIPDFPIGSQDFKFKGQDNTLIPGDYRDITLEKNAKLMLSGGTYNLNKLELKENSTLIFNAPTILNIQFKLKGGKKVSIFPGQNLNPQDLSVNYLGIKPKHEKQEKEDDDEEINKLLDGKEKKDHREQKLGRPIVFGQNSFLNFKLLAPKANIHIGEESTLRGNVWGRRIKIEKGGILSKESDFNKKSDPSKIIEDQGVKYQSNEIIVLLKDEAAFQDAQMIADLVNGKITGSIPKPQFYKIEVQTATKEELEVVINKIRNLNNTLIITALQNFAR